MPVNDDQDEAQISKPVKSDYEFATNVHVILGLWSSAVLPRKLAVSWYCNHTVLVAIGLL